MRILYVHFPQSFILKNEGSFPFPSISKSCLQDLKVQYWVEKGIERASFSRSLIEKNATSSTSANPVLEVP